MNLRLRKIALCLGAALLIALSASQASAQEEPPSTNSSNDTSQMARVAGTVLRAGTDEPLRKARVSLSNKDDKTSRSRVMVTGIDGKFAFEGLAPGPYDLSADHDGYVTKSYGEDSAGHGSAVLSLAAGQKMEDLIFRLQKCAVISGRVVDADGDPVRSVTVEAASRTTYRGKTIAVPAAQAETNDLGEYRLFDLAPGQYRVRATPSPGLGLDASTIDVPGSGSGTKAPNYYVPTYYPDVTDIARASMIELKAGDEIPSMDLTLIRSRTYKIRGQVADLTEGGVNSEFAINLFPIDGSESFRSQQMTDVKNGSFELDGLPAGGYLVIAMAVDERRQILKGFARVAIIDADVDSVRVVIKRGVELRG